MDIDKSIREAEAAAKTADELKKRSAGETARCVVLLQRAFDEFREALIRHRVQPVTAVRLDYARVRSGFLRKPGLKATIVGTGWPFHGLFIPEQGGLKVAPFPAAVGARIVPGGSGSNPFIRSALKALEVARLGHELSDNHYYLRDGASYDDVDWSSAQGQGIWTEDAHRVSVPRSSFLVQGSTLYIQLYRGDNQYDVLLENAFAEYIRSGGPTSGTY